MHKAKNVTSKLHSRPEGIFLQMFHVARNLKCKEERQFP
jgi:hypothetical protein